MSEREFLRLFVLDDKLSQIMTMIRYIDKDRNGYVTTAEMEDILQEVYPEKLKARDFKHILRVFTCVQNPILLDYNKFRDFIRTEAREISQDPLQLQRFNATPTAQAATIESKLAQKGVVNVADLFKFKSRRATATLDANNYLSERQMKRLDDQQSVAKDSNADRSSVSHRRSSHHLTAKERANSLIRAMNNKTSSSTENLKTDFNSIEHKDQPISKVKAFGIRAKSSVNPRPAQEYAALTSAFQTAEPVAESSPAKSSKSLSVGRPQTTIARNQRVKETLRNKLAYEWKHIYKYLARMDIAEDGKVSKANFQQCCEQAGVVNFTTEDLNNTYKVFGAGDDLIDYVQVSKELGLHKESFKLRTRSSRQQHNLTLIREHFKRTATGDRNRNLFETTQPKETTLNMEKIHKLLTVDATSESKSQEKRYTSLQQAQKLLSKRKQEFVNLVQLYQRKSGVGNSYKFDERAVIPVNDFKACLKAFSIRLEDKVSNV